MMQVGLEFGALLGRFWVDFWPNLGARLGTSWHQNRRKWLQAGAKLHQDRVKQKRGSDPGDRTQISRPAPGSVGGSFLSISLEKGLVLIDLSIHPSIHRQTD